MLRLHSLPEKSERCATQKAYPNVHRRRHPALGERPHLGCGTAFAKRMPAHGGRRAARSAQAPRPRPCEPRAAQCSTRRRRLNRPAMQESQSASIGLERGLEPTELSGRPRERADRSCRSASKAKRIATRPRAGGQVASLWALYPAGLARCKTHAPNAANR